MISDFVKGKSRFGYPEEIQKGIVLHRMIDKFTDGHAATGAAKNVFRPYYRLYSGPLTDVVFDHYLATEPALFSGNALLDFSRAVYEILDRHTGWFPHPFSQMYPFMKKQNWLYGYSSPEGISHSLNSVMRRATYLEVSDEAFRLFEKHDEQLRTCFRALWADLEPYARNELNNMNS